MNIVGVIPARYESTRFPGKPLADINGKPMIWWVYNQVKKVKELSEVYVATDDERIKVECEKYDIKVVMTKNTHKTVFDRVCEFSQKIGVDAYVIVNGDEPLIEPENIKTVIKPKLLEKYVINTISKIENPVEANDVANIKVVYDSKMKALYMSRNAIPFPNKFLNYSYWKHVGITALNKELLNEYAKSIKREFEKIEGIDHLRFIENGNKLVFVKLNSSNSLSVDTPKDLEKIKEIIKSKKEN